MDEMQVPIWGWERRRDRPARESRKRTGWTLVIVVIGVCLGLLAAAYLLALPAIAALVRLRRSRKVLGALYWHVLLAIDDKRRDG
jgi:hypothetical protein